MVSAYQRFYSPPRPVISLEAALSLRAMRSAVYSRSVRIATFSALFLFNLAREAFSAATYSLISASCLAEASDLAVISAAFLRLGSTSLKIS
jgi:hypothetical protein